MEERDFSVSYVNRNFFKATAVKLDYDTRVFCNLKYGVNTEDSIRRFVYRGILFVARESKERYHLVTIFRVTTQQIRKMKKI